MKQKYLYIPLEDVAAYEWTDTLVRKKGVCLENFEIEILHLLATHRIMPSKAIHEFYKHHQPERNGRAISNRLKKLVVSRLIFRKKHLAMHNNLPAYYYLVGDAGIALLKKLYPAQSYLAESELKQVRVPSAHNVFAFELAHEIYMSNAKRTSPIPFKLLRGAAHPAFVKYQIKLDNQERASIVPDYILETDEFIICLENDMSTERTTALQKKEKMYEVIAKTDSLAAKKLYVLYSIALETSNVESPSKKARRIHSLKESFKPYSQWAPNIEYYVSTSVDTVELVFLLLEKKYPLNSFLQQMKLSDFSNKVNARVQPALQNQVVAVKELILDSATAQNLSIPVVAEQFLQRDVSMTTAIKFVGEFGAVRSYQQMRTLNTLFGEAAHSLFFQQYHPVQIWCEIANFSNASHEQYGFTPLLPIYLMNVSMPFSKIWLVSSPYKKDRKEVEVFK